MPRRSLEPGTPSSSKVPRATTCSFLLDGVLQVEVDGETVAEVGPGAILGERAAVEGGSRTATLRAVTPCRVIELESEQISKYELTELAPRAGGRKRARPVVTADARCDNRRGGRKNESRPPVLTAWCPFWAPARKESAWR